MMIVIGVAVVALAVVLVAAMALGSVVHKRELAEAQRLDVLDTVIEVDPVWAEKKTRS